MTGRAELAALPSSEPDDAASSKKPSQATRMAEIGYARYDWGCTPTGAIVGVPKSGPPIARTIDGDLEDELAEQFRMLTGTVPGTGSVKDAVRTLKARAKASGRVFELLPRVARPADDMVVIDLGEPHTARAVVVTRDGWELVERPPEGTYFERNALTGVLPEPVRGGSIDELRDVVSPMSDESWHLAIGWALMVFLPDVAVPILMVRGPQGSAKSTTARVLCRLVDPLSAPLRSVPSSVTEWSTTAGSSRAIGIDNVSKLAPQLSDALCRAVTGDGIVVRQLYTNRGIVVMYFKRAIALTGITIEGAGDDLADRMLMLELDRIADDARRTDAELEAVFRRVHPRALGGLLDLLADVLARLPSTHPRELPRLADAARVYAAIDASRGTSSFPAFVERARQLATEAAELDPVAAAILDLVAERGEWRGTTKELHKRISPEPSPRGWPDDAQKLSYRLRRCAHALRAAGVELRHTRSKGQRMVAIQRLPELGSEAVQPATPVTPTVPSGSTRPFERGTASAPAATTPLEDRHPKGGGFANPSPQPSPPDFSPQTRLRRRGDGLDGLDSFSLHVEEEPSPGARDSDDELRAWATEGPQS